MLRIWTAKACGIVTFQFCWIKKKEEIPTTSPRVVVVSWTKFLYTYIHRSNKHVSLIFLHIFQIPTSILTFSTWIFIDRMNCLPEINFRLSWFFYYHFILAMSILFFPSISFVYIHLFPFHTIRNILFYTFPQNPQGTSTVNVATIQHWLAINEK